MRVLAALVAVAGGWSQVYADSQVVHVEVRAVAIRPLDNADLPWDGTSREDVPEPVSKHVHAKVKRFVAEQVVKAGIGVSIAPLLAAYAMNKFAESISPPDPFGELTVDGRTVGTLDKQANTFTPSWSVQVRSVEVREGGVLSVNLFDQDLAGEHDPIGSCVFMIPTIKSTSVITSKSCTNGLVAATLVLTKAAPATSIRPGRYRIGVARAGIPQNDVDGQPWDVSGFADPRLEITVGDARIPCAVSQGQYATTCSPLVEFDVDDTTTIAFKVVEVDPLVNDPVGVAAVVGLTAQASHRPIAMKVGGLVQWAEVVLEPVMP